MLAEPRDSEDLRPRRLRLICPCSVSMMTLFLDILYRELSYVLLTENALGACYRYMTAWLIVVVGQHRSISFRPDPSARLFFPHRYFRGGPLSWSARKP
jgi:hypothetical protein